MGPGWASWLLAESATMLQVVLAVWKLKMEKKLALWSTRQFTLEGKIFAIKAVLIPIMLYLFMAFPPTKPVLQKCTRLFSTFLWGSRMEKLSRNKVCKHWTRGGKGMPDVYSFMYSKLLCHTVSRDIDPLPSCASFFTRYFVGTWLRTHALYFPSNLGPLAHLCTTLLQRLAD